MSGSSLWKRDAKGAQHPVQELLLAYIREQCTEHEQNRVQEHLLAGCAPCNQHHTELKQSSHALNHLKYMSRYLYYPELQSNQVLPHMKRGEPLTSAWTGKRKRKFQVRSRGQYDHKNQSTGLRVFRLSFPVAFGLLLIFTTVAVVLAYTIASFMRFPLPLPWQPSGSFYHNPGPYEANVAPHTTPTKIVIQTITPSSSPGVTVTGSPTSTETVVKGPLIDFCPPRGFSGPFIVICGYDFNAGDKVSLVLNLYGKNTPVIWGTFPVDKHGEFAGWYVYSCKNPPVSLYARDDTLMPTSVVSNTLTHITVAGCHGPGSAPVPVGTPGWGW